MTPSIANISAIVSGPNVKDRTYFDNTFWGYIIRGAGLGNLINMSAQFVAAGGGILLVLASIIFWLVMGTAIQAHFGGLEYGMSIPLFLFGMVLIWFASHGTDFEFHVNVEERALYEIVRNSKGKARVLQTIPFDTVASAYIDHPQKAGGRARLILRLRHTSKNVVIATDEERNLRPILMRLVRDVLPAATGEYAQNTGSQHAPNFDAEFPQVMPRRVISKRPARGFMFIQAQGIVQPRRISMVS